MTTTATRVAAAHAYAAAAPYYCPGLSEPTYFDMRVLSLPPSSASKKKEASSSAATAESKKKRKRPSRALGTLVACLPCEAFAAVTTPPVTARAARAPSSSAVSSAGTDPCEAYNRLFHVCMQHIVSNLNRATLRILSPHLKKRADNDDTPLLDSTCSRARGEFSVAREGLNTWTLMGSLHFPALVELVLLVSPCTPSRPVLTIEVVLPGTQPMTHHALRWASLYPVRPPTPRVCPSLWHVRCYY